MAHNLRGNVVTLGWGDWVADVDAAEFEDKDALDRFFDQRFADHPKSRRRAARVQIFLFRDEIRIGDLVVLPPKNHEAAEAWIAIGEVTGPAIRDPDQPKGARLRREVKWLARRVPASAAKPDLRRSIRTPGTVFRSRADDAARRIRHLATHGEDPGPDSPALSGDEAGVQSEYGDEIPEGAKKRVEVNRYERDAGSRRLCLEHFGYVCQVCGLRFEERYGEIGQAFMHVHHKMPLSEIADHDNHAVNPLEDLVPVCPNCHAMLHRPTGKTLTVEELSQCMDEARERTEDSRASAR